MESLRLTLQGLWWRRGVSFLVLVVASATVCAAASGPLYLRAAGESVLRDTLTGSVPAGSGIEVTRQGRAGPGLLADLGAVIRAADPPGAFPQSFPALEFDASVLNPASGRTEVNTLLTAPVGACDHVTVTEGRCPRLAGEVMLPADAPAVSSLLGLGRPVVVRGFSSRHGPLQLTPVGFYRPVDPKGTYWWGGTAFGAVSNEGSRIDPVLTAPATFNNLRPGTSVRLAARLPLDANRVHWASVPSLEQDLTWFDDRLRAAGDDVIVWTSLPALLEVAERYRRALDLPVTLVVVQLLALGWVLLFTAVGNAVGARGVEVGLAQVRGFSLGATLAFAVLEILLVLAAAAPLGVLLAWVGVHALSDAGLAPGTPVHVDQLTLLAAAAALGGGLIAAGLAALRVIRADVVTLLHRSSRDRRPGWTVAASALTASAAVAALASVAMTMPDISETGGAPEAVSDVRGLLAPGLVSVVMAAGGLPLLAGLCWLLAKATRGRRWVALFLAVRQVARRPAGLRVMLVLTVALGLATFAITGFVVFANNHNDRAIAETGADRVLTVATPAGASLRELVRAADPSGRAAMAVEYNGANGPDVRLVGVDTARLGAVGYWRADLTDRSPSDLRQVLASDATPAVTLRADAMRAVVQPVDIPAPARARLVVDLAVPDRAGVSVDLGDVRRPAPVHLNGCADRECRVVRLRIERPVTAVAPLAGSVELRRLEIRQDGRWTNLNLRPRSWTAVSGSGEPVGGVVAHAAGLRLRNTDTGLVAAPVAGLPALPILTTRDAAAAMSSLRLPAKGLDGRPLPVSPVAKADFVPRFGPRAVLADLTALERRVGGLPQTRHEVWLAAHASESVLEHLQDAGVRVLAEDRAADREERFGRQPPALALLLFLGAACLAALLASGGAVLDILQTARRREFEIAAMGAIGLRRGSLRAALVIEQSLLLGTSTLLGLAGGMLALRVTLPHVPEYVDSPVLPALRVDPQPAVVATVAACMAVAVLTTVTVAGTLLVRRSAIELLREAQT
jgi:hypothetical protein